MTKHRFHQFPRCDIADAAAAVPSVSQRPARIARSLAAYPSSLHSWLSGPALTDEERMRARLSDAQYMQRVGTLLA